MRCPNCGAWEERREVVCRQCGATYQETDLLAFCRLEFLLAEMDVWVGRLPADQLQELRGPYAERLAALRARLIPEKPPPPAAEVVPPVAEAVPPAPRVPAVEAAPAPTQAPAAALPKPERVPFDEWLLSDRNIKIALYSGAILLVLAGIVFIGSRWGVLPGPAKFAVTLPVTGLFYLGGYSLYQRLSLRLGGIAVMGVASGFLPLNFAVLQMYVLGPAGLRDDVMWLIASPMCLLLYLLTAYWTRSGLFTFISVGALASTVTAALVVADAHSELYPLLAYLLLALVLLLLARRLQETPLAGFTRTPLLIITQVAAALLALAALGVALIDDEPLCLAGLFVGVLFYLATDVGFGWLAARWAAAGLFPLAIFATLAHLGFSDTATGMALMLLAMAYLGGGRGLERLRGRRRDGLPLYAFAYIVAGSVTIHATGEGATALILVLLGDVAILAMSAAIFRHRAWVYGAVWLFMLPFYLFLEENVPYKGAPYLPSVCLPHFANCGLLMGLLGLNYVAAGYALSRREVSEGALPRRGGPFLTAAVVLSAVVAVLAWGSPVIVTLLLAAIAALYLGATLWLGRPLLLFPALLAVNLGVYTVQGILLGYGVADPRALVIAYTALTLTLLLGGRALRRLGQGRWAVPLYVVGALDLAASYMAGLFDPPLAIGLSAVYAALLLTYAWMERPTMKRLGLRDIPVLTFLGLGAIVVGHFYVLHVAGLLRNWPPFTAGLCGLFVLVAWLLRRENVEGIYGKPLRWVGLGLALLPLVGALASGRPLVIAATFGIVGLTYAADAAVRGVLYPAYLGGAAFLVVYWALLRHFGVDEAQAYVLPPGLALLALGWRGRDVAYRLATLLGLAVLLGTSFVQSLQRGAFVYAMWLGVESLVAIGWGVRTHSRVYVSLGALALVVNVVTQSGRAFAELPRWIQLALTGGILLGGGIAFLVRREELLRARRAFTEEWKGWQP